MGLAGACPIGANGSVSMRLSRTTLGWGQAHRAGASPAPTIDGLGRPIRCIVGATLAVALGRGQGPARPI